MDFTKEYIIQAISCAANNLRLSSEKIEVVALLRERFLNAPLLADEINMMKKITELSKFAIKIGEINTFVNSGKIDFSKLSDKFREHSHYLVKDLSYVLDVVTPQFARNVFKEIDEKLAQAEIQKTIDAQKKEEPVPEGEEKPLADQIKEKLILDDFEEDSDFIFENYVDTVLKPIKSLDPFLTKLQNRTANEDEILEVIEKMKKHAELSKKVGFEILCNMHLIFAKGIELILDEELVISGEVIENLRSCLIVIVAIVRSKDVDITAYLTRAENFGKSLNLL
jgi:hypothetical protein